MCGKSQEHSTPGFVIFGHSQNAISGEDDDDDNDDDEGNGVTWDRSFEMLPSCAATFVDNIDVTVASVVVIVVVIIVVLNVSLFGTIVELDVVDIDVVNDVASSSVTLRHDVVIINVKTSRS